MCFPSDPFSVDGFLFFHFPPKPGRSPSPELSPLRLGSSQVLEPGLFGARLASPQGDVSVPPPGATTPSPGFWLNARICCFIF